MSAGVIAAHYVAESPIVRLALPRTGTPYAASAPFSSAWEVTTGGDRLPAELALGSDLTTIQTSLTENLATSPLDRLVRQYQIPVSALTSGSTIAGTVKSVMRGREQTSGIDSMIQLMVRVVDAAGTTEKGVLYGGQTATTVSANPADPNGELATVDQVRVLPAVMSPVSGLVGSDLVLVEIGYRNVNTSTTNTSTYLYVGAVSSLGWLSDTPGTTTDASPWVEFDLS